MKKLSDYEFQVENVEHSLKPKKRSRAVVFILLLCNILVLLKLIIK